GCLGSPELDPTPRDENRGVGSSSGLAAWGGAPEGLPARVCHRRSSAVTSPRLTAARMRLPAHIRRWPGFRPSYRASWVPSASPNTLSAIAQTWLGVMPRRISATWSPLSAEALPLYATVGS